MTGHMRRGVRYPLSEKARERYRYDLARARAGDPVAPAETPAQQAEQAERERAAKAKRERAAKARAKARRAAKAKRERAAKKRAAEKRAAAKRAAAKRAAKPKQQTASQRDTSTQRRVARALERKNSGSYDHLSTAHLHRQAKNEKSWREECEAMGIDPKSVKPPSRETVARMLGRRPD